MKLLIQAFDIDGNSDVMYAMVDIDEINNVLTKRKALFSTAKQFDEDVYEIKFCGRPDLVTCLGYISIDPSVGIDENGYCKVHDGFLENENPIDSTTSIVIAEDGWYISGEDENGNIIETRHVPFIATI